MLKEHPTWLELTFVTRKLTDLCHLVFFYIFTLPFSWSTKQKTRDCFLYIQASINGWCNAFGYGFIDIGIIGHSSEFFFVRWGDGGRAPSSRPVAVHLYSKDPEIWAPDSDVHFLSATSLLQRPFGRNWLMLTSFQFILWTYLPSKILLINKLAKIDLGHFCVYLLSNIYTRHLVMYSILSKLFSTLTIS